MGRARGQANDFTSDRFTAVLGAVRGRSGPALARERAELLAAALQTARTHRPFQVLTLLHDSDDPKQRRLRQRATDSAARQVVRAWGLDGWEAAAALGAIHRIDGRLVTCRADRITHLAAVPTYSLDNAVDTIGTRCGRTLEVRDWHWSPARRWYTAEARWPRCPACDQLQLLPAAPPTDDDLHLPAAWGRGITAEVSYVIASAGPLPAAELTDLAHGRARALLARRIARTVCADPAAAVHNAELGWSHGRPASRPAGFAPLTWQFDENALVGRIENEMLGSRPRTRGARTIRRLTKEAAAAALMQSRL